MRKCAFPSDNSRIKIPAPYTRNDSPNVVRPKPKRENILLRIFSMRNF